MKIICEWNAWIELMTAVRLRYFIHCHRRSLCRQMSLSRATIIAFLYIQFPRTYTMSQKNWTTVTFLPRCMECRRGLAMRILSVCLSVCPSVTRVDCDKTVERSVQIYIPYERTFSLVFWEEEWLVGATPFFLKFRVNRHPLEQNRRFWTDNRSYSTSAVKPSEKSSINAYRKSTTRFPMSLR